MTSRDLQAKTGLSARELRFAIRSERLSGSLILSDPAVGYFLPETPDDARRFVRAIEHRAREVRLLADAARIRDSPARSMTWYLRPNNIAVLHGCIVIRGAASRHAAMKTPERLHLERWTVPPASCGNPEGSRAWGCTAKSATHIFATDFLLT